MFRQPYSDPKKTHFGTVITSKEPEYSHRLNFYTYPPTEEITLDQFEQWAIDRLKVLGEIEACQYRNKSPEETETTINPLLKKYLPLNSSGYAKLSLENKETVHKERKKDHYSHFILRLAFARSPELRARFSRSERALFRIRWASDDSKEREAFIDSLSLAWESVSEDEVHALGPQLAAATGMRGELGSYFKVDWEKVVNLVETRKVFLKAGKAYVPTIEQISLVLAEFTSRLDAALDATARALPRLDEDDRLVPILAHLSTGFNQQEYDTTPNVTGSAITAKSIDGLVNPHFPLCMTHLHNTLKRTHHLKHFSRLQYTLFLKGIGLSVDESIAFWRTNLSTITDDKFNKEHRYNIRHAYGLEGSRRNYRPLSCPQILTDRTPGPGDTHGCPYRHFSEDNLVAALTKSGVSDKEVLKGVREDVQSKRFHMACNRVFESVHARELKRGRDEGRTDLLETIMHPNLYFTRSWELKNPRVKGQDTGVNEQVGEEM